MIADADREDLMLFYNIPAFMQGDANAFLSAVARANGLIKKVCYLMTFQFPSGQQNKRLIG